MLLMSPMQSKFSCNWSVYQLFSIKLWIELPGAMNSLKKGLKVQNFFLSFFEAQFHR